MNKKIAYLLLLLSLCSLAPAAYAEDLYRVRMYFGLSIPTGGGVSVAEWHKFETEELVKVFEGFNVVDSLGYYKGEPERCKIVTLILAEKDIPKAKKLGALYAKRFTQDSVMMVKVPVLDWSFIEKDYVTAE